MEFKDLIIGTVLCLLVVVCIGITLTNSDIHITDPGYNTFMGSIQGNLSVFNNNISNMSSALETSETQTTSLSDYTGFSVIKAGYKILRILVDPSIYIQLIGIVAHALNIPSPIVGILGVLILAMIIFLGLKALFRIGV